MAQLWGGRFTKETDQLVYNFNASISFDQKFYEQDIRGSRAHVKMLAKQGILTEKERDQILEGLEGILEDVKSGKLEITSEYEDIHSFVEANLIDRIGDPGKKLHIGRSRNEQVALDMKLYTKRRIFKMTCNLLYLFSLLYCVRVEEEALRKPLLFVFTLLLFALPLLFDVKSTTKYSNLIRIIKNLLYAVLLTGIVYLLIELLVSTFYLLF